VSSPAPSPGPSSGSSSGSSARPSPTTAAATADPQRATAIAAELAALLDVHLAELRSRGVDETVLAPIESELRRYSQARLAG
jgi:hypothetical protein